MAQWAVGSESGILRKNKPKDNHDDLLVFGYACKLFRDDDKASYIDKGEHLIPWMGDEKLKIDRYDCRGALSDITVYEASREGFDAMRWLGLNENERKIEVLCDKERYYSLHINEQEEEMYKEEEKKREKTNEFQYSYDVPGNPDKEMGPTIPEVEEEDEEYIPAPSLDLPVDISIPKTVKENARIEKTALFVYKQGPQMEILIKAKQADNPQFGFLIQGNPLYKYYRHVLAAIKSGRYQVVSKTKPEEQRSDNADNGAEDHYLHPSLLSASAQSDVQTSSIPAVPYKPSANCSYSQLVNRIQGSQPQEDQAESSLKPTDAFAQLTYEQQQYYQYYYTNQYYEYYKQLAQYQQGNGQSGQSAQPPDTQLDPSIQNYLQQMAYVQYMQNQASNNNPYAQIVSNVNKDVTNPYSALLTNLQQQPSAEQNISKEPVIYTSSNEESKSVVTESKQGTVTVATPTEAIKKPLLSLAQYGSDSDDEDEKQEEIIDEFKTPTGEIQIVIDKMASYVAKNGEQFEEIVKSRGDRRFEFLNEDNEFNRYYRAKLNEFKKADDPVEKKDPKLVAAAPPPPPPSKSKEKKVIAPVCFSIKKPKDDGPKEIKSALPMEESDDDDGGESTKTEPPQASMSDGGGSKDSETPNEHSNESTYKNGIFDMDDPILEMIDLTDDLEERKDAKRAEDKIKDKIAAAAREKMVSAAKDKALQLERKKKAAAFLRLKSAESVPEVPKKEKSPNIVSNNGSKKESKKRTRSRSKSKDKKSKDVVQVDDSGDESSKRRRSSKKKKSHKRKHSKSKHDSRTKKKSKKKHRRSGSSSSTNSKSS